VSVLINDHTLFIISYSAIFAESMSINIQYSVSLRKTCPYCCGPEKHTVIVRVVYSTELGQLL